MEKWRVIEGYEDLYEVSNMGRVRLVRNKNKFIKVEILKNSKNYGVRLRKNKILKRFLIKDLVANAFLDKNVNEKLEIKHLDGNFKNNNSENLYWGIPFRPRSKKINHYYFSEPNLENSYWAGFIAADGCIKDPKNRPSKGISIRLAQIDIGHLEKFKLNIKSDHEIFTGISKPTDFVKTANAYCNLSFSSNQIAEDLAKYWNIVPRKAMRLKPPNIINREQKLAFIAGYIDGDGSYSWTGIRYRVDGSIVPRRPTLSIYGTKEMLEWIRSELGDFDNVVGKPNSRDTYKLSYNGNKALFVRSLYIDLDLPFLERKNKHWEKTSNENKICLVTNNQASFKTPEFILGANYGQEYLP